MCIPGSRGGADREQLRSLHQRGRMRHKAWIVRRRVQGAAVLDRPETCRLRHGLFEQGGSMQSGDREFLPRKQPVPLEQFHGDWNLAGLMGFAALNPSYASTTARPGRMG